MHEKMGLPKSSRTAFPNWAAYGSSSNELLATFYETGEAVKINKQTGLATPFLTNLSRPHGINPLSDGRFAVSDTRNGHVYILNRDLNRIDLVLDFSKEDIRFSVEEDKGHEWIQHTIGLANGRIAVLDSRRACIYVIDLSTKEFTKYFYRSDLELQILLSAE
jgi:hypothetical protein